MSSRVPRGLRLGLDRARDGLVPVAWVSLATGVAYAVAGLVLGHPYPFFAAVAAFSALGFTADVQPRRVGEVALGISLGVGMGEAIQLTFGSGPLQTTAVVFVAVMIAKVLDPSPVLTTQSAVQSIVVLGLPIVSSSGGGIGRWTDALMGGAVALVFSLVIPRDPRRRPRALARTTLAELAEVLGRLGRGLHRGDPESVADALQRARSTQALLVSWEGAVSSASATARFSPAWHRHVGTVADLADACEFTDRAIRTTRVLARRAAVAVADGHADERLAGVVEELGVVTRRLGALIGSGRDAAEAVPELRAVAEQLGTAAERDPVRHTLLSLLRSVTFDLLRAAGQDERQAAEALRQRGGA
ncbi:hypothetical protein C8046_15480 [Serinibacter arcticus]|uniref:Integral membrane bound transporter domain-containing protein n=1 Tax=Serinibacter arcticus TaxID=1655435 RepID=A0A2U1ZXW8_9MICO|nr:FUSC family protein [Serinibacter arcticus]PWD51836.1 hypothetical protein C8046_15480 [Serinibacter arcticus]